MPILHTRGALQLTKTFLHGLRRACNTNEPFLWKNRFTSAASYRGVPVGRIPLHQSTPHGSRHFEAKSGRDNEDWP